MASQSIVYSFRPKKEFEDDCRQIDEWAKVNGSSFSSVLNSYIPAIAYAILTGAHIDVATGKIYVKSNFEHVLIQPTNYARTPLQKTFDK